jgi:hypothetical protein
MVVPPDIKTAFCSRHADPTLAVTVAISDYNHDPLNA